jgi:hypothetical protein
LSILIPAKDLVSPSLSLSGKVLNKAEGDLHDVKEMDFGFTLSFLKHHLASKPNVSAIPQEMPLWAQVTLPDNGLEVNFVSPLHQYSSCAF